MTQIPLSVPNISGNEWRYVKECLDTGWISSAGSYVGRFEDAYCEITDAAHAVACVSGTAALQTALRIVGVERGDEVIVPTLTFIASVNAISYLGAHPLFVDSDEYYNMDVARVLEFLSSETEHTDEGLRNSHTGRRIAAIMPVHVFGNAVDLNSLVHECRNLGVAVVEDAAESLGTVYSEGEIAGRHAGTVGDIGCYSFNGNKIVSTGGGGMIVTDNPDHASKARYLTTQAKDDPVRYVHDEIGYVGSIEEGVTTNVQAAIGVAQLENLPTFLTTKKANFERYRDGLSGISGLSLASTPPYADNNLWMYAMRIDEAEYGRNREETMAYLHSRGIQTRPVWSLNHLQTPYRSEHCLGDTVASALVENTLNVPCSTSLSSDDVDFVLEQLRDG